MVRYLTIEEILRLHFQIIEDFGGSHGVRNEARLRSVEQAPRLEAFGTAQYPGLHEKAAVYARNIIGDHPFTDGNKRTGITTAGIFLLRNDVHLTASPQELEDFAVRIAVERLDVKTIAAWLKSHTS